MDDMSLDQLEAVHGKVATEPEKPPRKSQATELVEIGRTATLFNCPDSDPYATVTVAGHQEHWPVRSKGFRDWLKHRYWKAQAKAPSSQAVADALGVLEGLARYEGKTYPVSLRLAEHEGHIYLDLCDPHWHCIEIDPEGWRVVKKLPIRFIRRRGMLPLPVPTKGGKLADLWHFLNVSGDDAQLLVSAWLVQALRPTGPYPVLTLQGEQGTAKSTFARILRSLIDPSVAELRTTSRDERDLLLAARNGWVVALDNLSGLPTWLSDGLCRLATGGGFSTRELYSDVDEVLIQVQRPIILNGIDDIATRHDLIDRSLILNLDAIPEGKRRDERDLWDAFTQARPAILGALLNAVSQALKNLPETKLDRLPRMADFALWATAAEPALGASSGQFIQVYRGNCAEAVETGLEGSPLANALCLLMERHSGWKSTPTELLKELERNLDEPTRRLRSWPRSTKALNGQLRRLTAALRSTGLHVAMGREREGRFITIDKMADEPSHLSQDRADDKVADNPSHPSHPSPDRENKGLSVTDRVTDPLSMTDRVTDRGSHEALFYKDGDTCDTCDGSFHSLSNDDGPPSIDDEYLDSLVAAYESASYEPAAPEEPTVVPWRAKP